VPPQPSRSEGLLKPSVRRSDGLPQSAKILVSVSLTTAVLATLMSAPVARMTWTSDLTNLSGPLPSVGIRWGPVSRFAEDDPAKEGVRHVKAYGIPFAWYGQSVLVSWQPHSIFEMEQIGRWLDGSDSRVATSNDPWLVATEPPTRLNQPALRVLYGAAMGNVVTYMVALFVIVGVFRAICVLARPSSGGGCRRCGYSLEGVASSVCPECGTIIVN
jgi:hypothetical protein